VRFAAPVLGNPPGESDVGPKQMVVGRLGQGAAILRLVSGYACAALGAVGGWTKKRYPHRVIESKNGRQGIESTSCSVYCHKQAGHVTSLTPPPVTPDDCTALALHLATVCIIPGHLESHLIPDPPVRLWCLCRDAVLRRDGV
jgi:hypothetical protein